MPSARIWLQVPALVCAILGFLLLWISLATPAWQVVYARELQQWVQSGLWINCQTRPSGMYTCTYTFDEHDFDFYTSAEVVSLRTPPFYAWQRTLLHIFLIAQLSTFVALVAFCVSNMQSGQRCSVIVFSVSMLVAVLLTVSCVLAFSVLSHMVEYRFYHVSVSGIYEKHLGYSFYLSLIGSLFYLCSLVISVAYSLQVFRGDRYGYAGSNDQNGSVFRSDDFRLTDEELFAMRALPQIPTKYR